MAGLLRASVLRWVAILVTAIAAMFAPQASSAQEASELRLLVETGPGLPLAGALVALVDTRGRVVIETLTTRGGHVILRASPGEYRVRVRRIGYEPYVSPPVVIPHESELRLLVESARVVLTTVLVTAPAECGPISPEAATLASVWEEIAKALRSSQLTADDLSELGRASTYQREILLNGSVVSSVTRLLPASRGRPFAAIDHESLLESGYVRGNERDGWQYFGPDEAVLLSDGFAQTHCFRLVRERERQGQLGVAFDPAPNRRIADIRGVLWIDEESLELREVSFRYANAGMVSRFNAGGFTRFRRMGSGAWIVSEWQLRMPRLETRSRSGRDVALAGYFERGGSLSDQ